MMMISDQKNNIDLVSIVKSAGVELKQRGSRHIGLCPFHDEKTPSFFIFDNNRYRCFGSCGAHGDVIDFVQKLHGFSFKDALRYLGIEQKPITPAVKRNIKRRKRRAELVEQFRRWEVEKTNELGLLIRCTHKVIASWKSIEDFEREAVILQPLALCEYKMALLIFGNDKQKFQLYIEAQNNGKIRFRQ